MNRKGFTLLELMIVISIIFVLAAVIIPMVADQDKKEETKIEKKEKKRNFQTDPITDAELEKKMKQFAETKKRWAKEAAEKEKNEAEIRVEEERLNSKDLICLDGFKVMIVDGETYYIGKRDDWGDIKPLTCN